MKLVCALVLFAGVAFCQDADQPLPVWRNRLVGVGKLTNPIEKNGEGEIDKNLTTLLVTTDLLLLGDYATTKFVLSKPGVFERNPAVATLLSHEPLYVGSKIGACLLMNALIRHEWRRPGMKGKVIGGSLFAVVNFMSGWEIVNNSKIIAKR